MKNVQKKVRVLFSRYEGMLVQLLLFKSFLRSERKIAILIMITIHDVFFHLPNYSILNPAVSDYVPKVVLIFFPFHEQFLKYSWGNKKFILGCSNLFTFGYHVYIRDKRCISIISKTVQR